MVLAGALGATGARAQTQSITVTLSSYDFTPDIVNLRAGVDYRLHLVNDSMRDHSFSAPEFFAASTVDAQDQSKVAKGTVEVPANASVDVALKTNSPGSYALHCDHFLHALFGMTGRIVVQ
jgi:uncharacterized cupredoxin-like copper-binding protein